MTIVTPCKCSVLNLNGGEFPALPVSFCGGTNYPKTQWLETTTIRVARASMDCPFGLGGAG